jgi:hypothetical protein
VSAQSIEVLLARLYTDRSFREAFLTDPERIARAQGLDDAEVAALCRIDREGLAFAARSFAHKRDAHARHGRSWYSRLLARAGQGLRSLL